MDDITVNQVSVSESSSCPSLCDICHQEERKYKCPRCATFTCSLNCCLSHKKQLDCNGQRDRTKYVPIKEFQENHLRSDFHFLEDVLQTKDSAKRTFSMNCGGEKSGAGKRSRTNKWNNRRNNAEALIVDSAIMKPPKQSLDSYSPGIRSLVHAAHDRGVELLLQPHGMSKRKENESYFDKKAKVIYWKITIVFILSEAFTIPELLGYDASLQQCKEKLKKKEVLPSTLGFHVKDVIESISVEGLINKILNGLPNGSTLKHILKPIHAVRDSLHTLLRVIPSPANAPLFRDIPKTLSLQEIFSGHTFIEFPTIYFTPPEHLSKLRLMVYSSGLLEEPFAEEKDGHSLVSIVQLDGSKLVEPMDRTAPVAKNSTLLPGIVDYYSSDSGNEGTAELNSDNKQKLKRRVDEEENEEEEDDEEDAGGGGNDYDEFMNALIDLQDRDIKSLATFIEQEENRLHGE